MRRLSCLGIVAAAVLAVPTAQAVTSPSVTVNVSKFQVRYGEPLRLAGTVSNHKGGVQVAVLSRSFTSAGFHRIATVVTGSGGDWAYSVKPGIATAYQARTGGNESRTLLVGVRPAVTMSQLANGRLRVEAAASRSFAGRKVKLQRRANGTWSTIAQLRLGPSSRAVVPPALVPAESSTLRAVFSVNQAGQGFLGAFSPPMVLRSHWVSLALSKPEITFGDAVTLSGRVSTRQSGMLLTVLARPAAEAQFQPVAYVTTGHGGRWILKAQPKVGTVYRAQSSGVASRVLGVGVHPDVKARIVSGERVAAHVGAGRSLAGRTVRLQQLTGGQWRTVAKATLDGNSDAVFPVTELPGGVSTLRIAMSVNQAGSGLMGAFSRPFAYQR